MRDGKPPGTGCTAVIRPEPRLWSCPSCTWTDVLGTLRRAASDAVIPCQRQWRDNRLQGHAWCARASRTPPVLGNANRFFSSFFPRKLARRREITKKKRNKIIITTNVYVAVQHAPTHNMATAAAAAGGGGARSRNGFPWRFCATQGRPAVRKSGFETVADTAHGCAGTIILYLYLFTRAGRRRRACL